jgi:hypothetical protein
VVLGTTVASIEQIAYPITAGWMAAGIDLASFFLGLSPLTIAKIQIPGHFAGKNDTSLN